MTPTRAVVPRTKTGCLIAASMCCPMSRASASLARACVTRIASINIHNAISFIIGNCSAWSDQKASRSQPC